jgi:hypothetical protein
MAYALGAVKPWVKTAADEVGTRFSVSTIYGVGIRAGESDHPKGLALDFMVGTDAAKGDSIANFVQQNAGHYGVTYIIWKQHIWSTGRASEGWRQMSDRGSITANHFDHVHVSFAAKGASNASLIVPGPVGGLVGGLLPHVPNPVSDIGRAERCTEMDHGFPQLVTCRNVHWRNATNPHGAWNVHSKGNRRQTC